MVIALRENSLIVAEKWTKIISLDARSLASISQSHNFNVQVRHEVNMKISRSPNTTSNATTAHKLEGSSLDNIYLCTCTLRGKWLYFLTSRAKTNRGLFVTDKPNSNRNSNTQVAFSEPVIRYCTRYITMGSQQASTDEYLRVAEFLSRTPILRHDNYTGDNRRR